MFDLKGELACRLTDGQLFVAQLIVTKNGWGENHCGRCTWPILQR